APAFTDLDRDGLLDMLVGEFDGNINHYEQDEINSDNFTYINDDISNIDVGMYAAPLVYDINGDNEPELFAGEYGGVLKQYTREISELDCGSIGLGGNMIKHYYVKQSNLESEINISCSGDRFSISLDSLSGFSNSVIISGTGTDFTNSIYVKFSPDSLGSFNGSISHTSSELDQKFILLTGSCDFPEGIPGGSLSFNGYDEFVNIPDNSTLDLINSYTLEAWIKPEVFTSSAGIISKYQTTSANGYMLRLSNIAPYRSLRFDEMYSPADLLEAGKWYHVAAVNDNGNRHLYLNGEELPLTGSPLNVVNNSNSLCIGLDYSSRYFNGQIDEVKLWNTARTQSQIRESMNIPLTALETGLVSYWQLNENTGDTVTDRFTGNDGTLVNMDDTNRTASTIPFGSGEVCTQTIASAGSYDFTGTGIVLDVDSVSGSIEVVISRINLSPNIIPQDVNTVMDSQYWVVRKYGTGDFTADIKITVSEDLSVSDESGSSIIKLYKRTSNSDGSWAYELEADSVNSVSDTAIFSYLINSDQLIILRGNVDVPQNITTNISGSDFILSWSPVPGAASYKVYSSNDPYGTFAEEVIPTVGETWTIPYTESKKFYYVVAVDSKITPVAKKKINVKKNLK
ncbi:MAG: hypothetical protein JXN63_07690, partial [Candidatus Delongbacteria bacterium]|nr:hypothetical protein [Candidatus Delongbacteria bacterium]